MKLLVCWRFLPKRNGKIFWASMTTVANNREVRPSGT